MVEPAGGVPVTSLGALLAEIGLINFEQHVGTDRKQAAAPDEVQVLVRCRSHRSGRGLGADIMGPVTRRQLPLR